MSAAQGRSAKRGAYDAVAAYLDYAARLGNRKALYQRVADEFGIDSALYPGSHIDIAPSLVIPKVTYVDQFKGAIRFFKYREAIQDYLNAHKNYDDACEFSFLGQDFYEPLDTQPVDLIISQFAGFAGQATKGCLKPGGILLCNDSHGDATLARFDDGFELAGVLNGHSTMQTNRLDDYFRLPHNKPVDLNAVKAQMKGLKYELTAENYVFKKSRQAGTREG